MMKKDSPLLQKLLQLPSLEENYPRLKKFPTQLEQLGITLADAEELAEIATNKSLLAGTASEFFAVHYALFALGGLKYVEACPKIFTQFYRLDDLDDEWTCSFSDVFLIMGEAVIPYLLQGLQTIKLDIVYVFTECLGDLALRFPQYRQEILGALDQLHERFEKTMFNPNALFYGETAVLMAWMDMKAVERIDLIRELNQKGRFDPQYAGSIEEIEYEFGLRDTPPPRPHSALLNMYGMNQPFQRTEEKIGRNDPCPCGSSKKYKKCCLK